MTTHLSPNQDPPPDGPGRKKQRPLLPILFTCLLAAGLGLAAWFHVPSRSDKDTVPARATAPTQDRIPGVPEKPVSQTVQEGPAPARPEDTPSTGSGQPEKKSGTVIGPFPDQEQTSASSPPPPDRNERCQKVGSRLRDFFLHLDGEEYFQEFAIGQPSEKYFTALARKLLEHPPVVSRESDDLYTMLRNMAHFFRVIGGRNITIIKTILDRERDKIEDVAADLYQWTTDDHCPPGIFSFTAPLSQLYEYAGFFLGSMGGRSYLFRRDSRSRLLVDYYAILLVDRANQESMNRHGIDLKEVITQTIREIEATNQLIYKERYLDTLYRLEERYQ